MRCLTLWQPWASLIAVGAKTIETRGWATKYRGPLAIHAAKRRPPIHWQHIDDDLPPAINLYAMDRYWEWTEGDDYYNSHRWVGPLGAIVATAQLVDCVPIVESLGSPDDPLPRVCNVSIECGLRLMRLGQYPSEDISDQLPYGDFTPGRWAWLLDDVKPTTERCPWCWGSMADPESDEGWHYYGIVEPGSRPACPVCVSPGDGYPVGRCDPIPAKGKQGLWRWTP